jgi:hypothetical protein
LERTGIRELNPEDEYLASVRAEVDERRFGRNASASDFGIKGECMDRIGGDSPVFEDLLARERIDR